MLLGGVLAVYIQNGTVMLFQTTNKTWKCQFSHSQVTHRAVLTVLLIIMPHYMLHLSLGQRHESEWETCRNRNQDDDNAKCYMYF